MIRNVEAALRAADLALAALTSMGDKPQFVLAGDLALRLHGVLERPPRAVLLTADGSMDSDRRVEVVSRSLEALGYQVTETSTALRPGSTRSLLIRPPGGGADMPFSLSVAPPYAAPSDVGGMQVASLGDCLARTLDRLATDFEVPAVQDLVALQRRLGPTFDELAGSWLEHRAAQEPQSRPSLQHERLHYRLSHVIRVPQSALQQELGLEESAVEAFRQQVLNLGAQILRKVPGQTLLTVPTAVLRRSQRDSAAAAFAQAPESREERVMRAVNNVLQEGELRRRNGQAHSQGPPVGDSVPRGMEQPTRGPGPGIG